MKILLHTIGRIEVFAADSSPASTATTYARAISPPPRYFSRHRILDFPTLVSWFLSGPRAAVQTELDRFFTALHDRAELVRQHLPCSVFTDLAKHLLALIEQRMDTPRWHGLRVVTADASDMRLSSRDATRRAITWAKVFALYLPGLDMTLGARLYTPDFAAIRQKLPRWLNACDLPDIEQWLRLM